ncbi:hypothetical protein COCNU_07G005460 [Cocos nucifera]|uniref:Uncharacterized protein n=1 Tax=Cocos nucifera TaxID=13894 RepID=A0A8K0IFD1_COCNU|nr:hypothetical protein COCNU_07G005460 [Cocos nucifera]
MDAINAVVDMAHTDEDASKLQELDEMKKHLKEMEEEVTALQVTSNEIEQEKHEVYYGEIPDEAEMDAINAVVDMAHTDEDASKKWFHHHGGLGGKSGGVRLGDSVRAEAGFGNQAGLGHGCGLDKGGEAGGGRLGGGVHESFEGGADVGGTVGGGFGLGGGGVREKTVPTAMEWLKR